MFKQIKIIRGTTRTKRWWKISKLTIIVVLLLAGLGTFFWVEEIPYYSKKLLWTKFSLKLARENISRFKKLEGRNPISLNEINEYATKHPNCDLRKKAFGEYISNTDGNRSEHRNLDGEGGLYYNPNIGEVKVNLTKPVKHYLKFYFGKDRNKIPADW